MSLSESQVKVQNKSVILEYEEEREFEVFLEDLMYYVHCEYLGGLLKDSVQAGFTAMKVQRTNLVLYRFNKLIVDAQLKIEFQYDKHNFRLITSIHIFMF